MGAGRSSGPREPSGSGCIAALVSGVEVAQTLQEAWGLTLRGADSDAPALVSVDEHRVASASVRKTGITLKIDSPHYGTAIPLLFCNGGKYLFGPYLVEIRNKTSTVARVEQVETRAFHHSPSNAFLIKAQATLEVRKARSQMRVA